MKSRNLFIVVLAVIFTAGFALAHDAGIYSEYRVPSIKADYLRFGSGNLLTYTNRDSEKAIQIDGALFYNLFLQKPMYDFIIDERIMGFIQKSKQQTYPVIQTKTSSKI